MFPIIAAIWITILFPLMVVGESESILQGMEIEFHVEGETLQLTPVGVPVKLPPYLQDQFPWSYMYGAPTLTDNPLPHGAWWNEFGMLASTDGFSLSTSLVMEQRGTSYGTYSLGNLIVYPRYYFQLERALFTGYKPEAKLGVGNVDNFRLYEGLMIGNIDVDLLLVQLKWNHLRFSVTNIADLAGGNGLNIDDGRDYVFSLEALSLGEQFQADLRLGYFDYSRYHYANNGLKDTGIRSSFAISFTGNGRVYGEFGFRQEGSIASTSSSRSAWLTGVDFGVRNKNFAVNLVGEYRRYGAGFNSGFQSNEELFIFRDRPEYDDNQGDQLYPLKNYNRPFAQWAVYTQYRGRNVETFILQMEVAAYLFGNFSLVLETDWNYLAVQDEESFVYPFYDAGLVWEPINGISLKISQTNKAMNLDSTYQTFYLLRDPGLLISARWELAF